MKSVRLCTAIAAIAAAFHLDVAAAANPPTSTSAEQFRADGSVDSNGTWKLLSNPGLPPPVFNVPAGAYDPVRDRLLVIEAGLTRGVIPITVHALDLRPEPHWSTLITTGAPLAERPGASVVYDPVRDRLLLFDESSEVWGLALSADPSWQELMTTGPQPPHRADQTAVYDPVRDQLIVFGGYSVDSANAFFADTWALSLRTNRWGQLDSVESAPPARLGHGAIYDPAGDRMIVFGGENAAGLRNDLWALTLGNAGGWTQLFPAGALPQPRHFFGTIYDPVRHQMIIHSGVQPDDVWLLSLSGALAWTQMATLDTLYGRAFPVDVYDPTGDRLLDYGGAQYAQSAALPLAGPFRWALLAPPFPPTEPGPRSDHAVVYDSRRHRVVAFGGNYGTTDIDVWAFSPGDVASWTPLLVPGSVGGFSSAAIYDPAGDRVARFTGEEVWTLPLDTAPKWSKLDASFPGPVRADASAIYDPIRRRLIVYGGVVPEAHLDEYTVSDIWALELDGSPVWRLLGQGPEPNGSAGHAMFYDPVRDRMVVMGGYWGTQAARWHSYGDTIWVAQLDSVLSWAALPSAGLQPPAPPSSNLLYDSNRDRMLLFSASGVWSRPAMDAGQWHMLEPIGQEPVVKAPVVFDPIGDQAVMLFAAGSGALPEQAWALSFASPPIVPKPTLALVGLRPNPAVRAFHVAFSLPDASPATLDLFDVRGRRLTVRDVGNLGPGEHSLDLRSDRPLPPGVYLIRLRNAQRSFTARAVLIR